MRLALLLLLLVPSLALAQQNRAYPIQGLLTDTADVPIDGDLSVAFALYADETGGTALWSEAQTVSFAEGLFSVFLGDVQALDPALFAGHEGLWLGIAVGGDPEMDRVFVGAAPYAGYAELAGNVPTTLGELSGTLDVASLPAGLAIGPTFCPTDFVVRGVDGSGTLQCEAVTDTLYTGADFALSSQACGAGQVVVEIDATGTVVCEAVLAGLGCAQGDLVTGFDAAGEPVCEPALDVLTSSTGDLSLDDLTLSGLLDGEGAAFGGDVVISGDLDVQGSVTLNGLDVGYPTNPQVLFGSENGFCNNNGTNVGWIDYPVRFGAPPVLVAGIDESINNNGATWMRVERSYGNRAGLRCDSMADSVDWLAIEPGVHTIDNKTVMAGQLNTATSGDAIFFPAVFTQPPVVLVFPDETGNQSGAARARIINTVTTGGFEIWLDNPADNLNWVAFDAGEYTYGPWHFYAGVWNINNSCVGGNTNCQVNLPSGMFTDAVDLIASLNDTNNSGASYVRSRLLTNDEIRLYLNGSTENVHYVAFERN